MGAVDFLELYAAMAHLAFEVIADIRFFRYAYIP